MDIEVQVPCRSGVRVLDDEGADVTFKLDAEEVDFLRTRHNGKSLTEIEAQDLLLDLLSVYKRMGLWKDPTVEGLHARSGLGTLSREDLEWRVVRNVKAVDRPLPRWALVSHATGYGSTEAKAMCYRVGVDPDEEISPPITGNPGAVPPAGNRRPDSER